MKITIDDFKRLVIEDYKTLIKSNRIMESKSEEEALDIVRNCDLAQLVLSKFVGSGDMYVSSKINLTYNLIKGSNEMELSALAPAEIVEKAQQIGVPNMMVYATSNISFDMVYEIISKKLPIVYVIYNVADKGAPVHTNGDIQKMLSGFTSLYKDRISVVSIKGGDYASLFGTFEKQTDYTRRYRCPSISIIDKSEDSIGELSKWIVEKGLAEKEELSACCQQPLE